MRGARTIRCPPASVDPPRRPRRRRRSSASPPTPRRRLLLVCCRRAASMGLPIVVGRRQEKFRVHLAISGSSVRADGGPAVADAPQPSPDIGGGGGTGATPDGAVIAAADGGAIASSDATPSGSCAVGAARCGANQTPERCAVGGTWEAGKPCEFVCAGDGQCSGVCKPAAKRCSANAVQTCAPDGSGYVDSESCPLGCDLARNACIGCVAQPENCANGKDDDCDGQADCRQRLHHRQIVRLRQGLQQRRMCVLQRRGRECLSGVCKGTCFGNDDVFCTKDADCTSVINDPPVPPQCIYVIFGECQ
jgi:hypothetical protein